MSHGRFGDRLIAAGTIGLSFALAGYPVHAADGAGQSQDFPDLVPVAVWTIVAALIGLSVASIGYLYRRERGLNTPLPSMPIPEPGEGALDAHAEGDGQGH